MFIIFSGLCKYFRKSTKPLTNHNWLFNDSSRLAKLCQIFPNNILHDNTHKLTKFHDKMMYNLKYIQKCLLPSVQALIMMSQLQLTECFKM